MPTIETIIQNIKQKRRLYSQVLFTIIAFLAMAVLSYYFMSSIVSAHIVDNAESVLSFAQAKINSDLMEPVVTLGGFSETVRRMIINGAGAEELRDYTTDLSEFIQKNGPSISSSNGFYGYYEKLPGGPEFINGIGWNPPASYKPIERPWYFSAVAAGDRITETQPYVDEITGEVVFTFTRCIHDDDGNKLGVVGLDIRLNLIGEYIVETALTQGGYGMLLDKNLNILAHQNPEYVGKNVVDANNNFVNIADTLFAGDEISEAHVVSYSGEASIIFVRRLANGWYLGLVTPKNLYYKSVTNMAIIFAVLATLLASILIGIMIRIEQAKNKSDMESKRKSVFLANMSHEIRTPMNAIIGMTFLGKSAPSAERKDYCLKKIEDAGHHLLGVINDILDMSKIEANKLELSSIEFNFEKMLQQAANVVNFRIDEKKQKFSVHIDNSIPKTLVGDDQRLVQVIVNLLGNANKFTPTQGSISLRTRMLDESDGVYTIQFSVKDSGIGISSEQQARLFQAFEQAESSTTRNFGGTGLGLAISKQIVEMMGGRIWVDSSLSKGSSFNFTIRAKSGAKANHTLSIKEMSHSDIRILVVDDDPDVLMYFKEVAHEFGITCDTASSGEDALRLIEQNGTYDVCFVDWIMPVMDGPALAKTIRAKYPALNGAVITLISAAEWRLVEDEAKNSGVDKFLPKPLFPSSIMDSINESLDLERWHTDEEQPDTAGIFEGHHILIAEDVEINREIVLSLLEPTLMEIDCATNGMEAVRMFDTSPKKYDLIFMDLQMPEMDGYEATRRIRALNFPKASTIPIIAMTANVFREDIEKCMEAGMNDHVGKPLDFKEIINKLNAYMKPAA